MQTVGIDTNVLLDFRLRREPGFNVINKKIQQCLESKLKIYIPVPVILEVEWVLRSYYKQDKETIISFFEELLLLDNILADYKEEIKFGLNLYKNSNKVSLTDSIIVAIIKSKDYEFLTFDTDLKKIYQSLL